MELTTVRRYKSRSSPNTFHKVQTPNPRAKRVRLVCTCKGFTFTKHCWHVAKVKESRS